MLLYYFTKSIFGLEAIRDRRIKLSRISSLNDPFELLGFNLKNRDRRKLFNEFKSYANKEFGLICMSSDWTHPLMWGHYADMHKGICLGFEVPENSDFEKVVYRSQRPDPPQGFNDVNKFSENYQAIKNNFYSKFKAWEYEQEYRLFVPLKDHYKDPVSGLYFMKFNSEIKLRRVIVGHSSEVSRAQLKEVIGDDHLNIDCFKARPAFQSFMVVENKRKSAWK